MKNKPTKNVPKKFFIKIVLFYLGGQSVVGRNKLFNLIEKSHCHANVIIFYLYFLFLINSRWPKSKSPLSILRQR